MLTPIIWVLEDCEDQQVLFERALASDFRLCHFKSLAALETALEKVKLLGREHSEAPSLLLADIFVEDGSFIDWIQRRGRDLVLEACPFVVVSAFPSFEVIQACFHLGASDFLSKPIELAELRFKVKRVLNSFAEERQPHHLAYPTRPNELMLDAMRSEVRGANKCAVRLTQKEFAIVHNLYSSRERRMNRQQLSSALWPDTTVVSKSLDVHVSRVRRKLSSVNWSIKSMRPDQFLLVHEKENHHAHTAQVWIP